jgi:hypothetical protein
LTQSNFPTQAKGGLECATGGGFADGKPLHIFISDVAVKVADKWVDAK